MRWHATQDPAAARAAANAEYGKATQDPDARPKRAPARSTRPKLERKTVPQLLETQALLERLALVAHYVANPEELIRRAAIAMAKRREIAYRLSLVAAPKPRGHLAVSAAMAGVIIPFHAEFKEALLWFAISHTEPDTT
jgi:hypothetical protein